MFAYDAFLSKTTTKIICRTRLNNSKMCLLVMSSCMCNTSLIVGGYVKFVQVLVKLGGSSVVLFVVIQVQKCL